MPWWDNEQGIAKHIVFYEGCPPKSLFITPFLPGPQGAGEGAEGEAGGGGVGMEELAAGTLEENYAYLLHLLIKLTQYGLGH